MRKMQQDKPAAPKTKDKPRFIVTREYNGSQSMRAAFEQAIESQACGQFESWLEKRGSDKMPVENFAETWYHDHIVSLFIKEITNEQEE